MLKAIHKYKKLMSIVACVFIVFAMACVNASETGVDAVTSELETGLSATNIWGAIGPMIGLVIIVTLIAIARRVLNKNLNASKSGKAGKV